MKLSIMQPYLFPHLGYFQLINIVDKFILYDDVSFIKKGWINRNRILLNRKAHLITFPLRKSSQNVLIKDLELYVNELWIKKFLMTIEHAYCNAPYFKRVFSIIKSIVNIDAKYIKDWHIDSFNQINEYLGIDTIIEKSSSIYDNNNLHGQHRIIDICKKENAKQYINPIGGLEIYDKDSFLKNGIILSFLESKSIDNYQLGKLSVKNLSIIDVMMSNSPNTIKSSMDDYILL